MNNMTPVVKQLLIINILFFLGSLAVPAANDLLALHYFESNSFGIWQLFTHMFMHGNITHIAFNMFALVSFGSILEHFWGAKRFLLFYFSCGLGAALLQLGVNYYELHQTLHSLAGLHLTSAELHQILNVNFVNGDHYSGEMFQTAVQPILEKAGVWQTMTQENFNALFRAATQVDARMVGASGAIYGLLPAFAFLFPDAKLAMFFIPVPIKAKYFVPIIVAMDLFSGVTGVSVFGGGIAHFAHVGGALIGVLLMLYWRNNKFTHNRWN